MALVDVPRVLRGARLATIFSVTSRAFSTTTIFWGPLAAALKSDHHQLGSYYPHIIDNSSLDERTRYQNLFVWELARHLVAKELVVYPAMEDSLHDGGALSKKSRNQNQKIKVKLHTFQKLKADDPDFLPTFKGLKVDVQKTAADEEERDIPRLEDQLQGDRSLELSRAFDRTKMLAPTRSHPSASEKPLFGTAAVLLTTPIDKIADIFRKFPKQDPAQDFLDSEDR
ncbi:hypothetical protein F5X99DRAFT_48725 [Biscogniauxia marginata]|nr:hypothetical protein F5X99DRAFT_48725 [Biscogniauxia marginata]